MGLNIYNLDYSPIKGPAGNIEYLIYMQKRNENNIVDIHYMKQKISKVVEEAHKKL